MNNEEHGIGMNAVEFLAEVKRVAETWPSEKPPYMLYASTDLILSGNYDDAVREGFDAGVAWAEHANRDRTLRLVAALEAVVEFASRERDSIFAQYGVTGAIPADYRGFANACGDVLDIIEAALAAEEEGEG